jgi:hypothetical protein
MISHSIPRVKYLDDWFRLVNETDDKSETLFRGNVMIQNQSDPALLTYAQKMKKACTIEQKKI